MPLTAQKSKKLHSVIAEMQARGLEVPEEMIDQLRADTKHIPWPVDSNGYFVKQDGQRYNPLEIHDGFFHSDALFVSLIGGRGVGKSSIGAQKVLQKLKEGKSGVVMNPDFENFKISTWPELKEWIPWDLVIAQHKHRASPGWFPNQPFIHAFYNGATMLCKGLKNAESARGPNVNWFWYDEGGRDDTGDGFRIAVPSVRVGKNPQIFVTGTPNGDDHWMSRFFVYKEVPDEVHEILKEVGGGRELIETFRGSTMDNKSNLEPETLALIVAQYPEGWLKQQEIYGEVVKQGVGALGNPAWFDGKVLFSLPESVKGRVRYWDLAATEKKSISKSRYDDPDETVGTKMSHWITLDEQEKKQAEFCIEDQVCGHWEWDDILDAIVNTAMADGPYVKIYVEQEPASGGKNQVVAVRNYVRDKLPGWPQVEGHNPKELGDKVMRANYWFHEASQGRIWLMSGEWNESFLRQLSSFPVGRHDDKIDSPSGARAVLAPIRKWKEISFLKV